MVPLPEPFSPVISTLASDGPTRAIKLEHRAHRRRFGDERRLVRALVAQQPVLGLEALTAPQRPPELHLRPDDGQHALVVPRLLDEVAGAAAHRLDGEIHRAPGRHDDDGHGRVELLEPREQREAFFARRGVARVVQIDQRDVEIARVDGGQHAGRRRRRFDVAAFRLEQQPQRLEDVGLVVGDEESAPSTSTSGEAGAGARRGEIGEVGHQSFTSQPSRRRMMRVP